MKRALALGLICALALVMLTGGYTAAESRMNWREQMRAWLRPTHGRVELPTPAPTCTPVPTPAPTPAPLMAAGDRGDEVKELQKKLREWGFMLGGVDGIYGPKTEGAVRLLRAYMGEEETVEAPLSGSVDEAVYAMTLEGGFDGISEDMATGRQGADVMRLQRRLNDLGYLSGGIDGIFGGNTRRAVTAFQKRNDLGQSGEADRATQEILFSDRAKKQVRPSYPYQITVNTGKQKVYVHAWSTDTASYSNLVKSMTCSTGLSGTPTPKGTFRAGGPVARWGYFPKWDVWAQYLYRINGAILFHSVLYTDSNEDSLIAGSLYKLGQPASHGCVRLSVADAKWLYNNCAAGTTVKVV